MRVHACVIEARVRVWPGSFLASDRRPPRTLLALTVPVLPCPLAFLCLCCAPISQHACLLLRDDAKAEIHGADAQAAQAEVGPEHASER